MIYYKLRRDRLHHEDIGKYVAFGIDVFDNNKLIRTVKDVSIERKPLAKLALFCNRFKLDPIHLDDVIEDFIY